MKDLITRSLEGDHNSYIELIKLFQVELYKIAYSQLDNIEDINDALQETIITSYKKLNSLKDYNFFKTWIIRILINKCHDIYRKKEKQHIIFNKISSLTDINKFYTEQDNQEKENDIDFDLLIRNLSKDERLILTLYYKNMYTPTEISKILNINVNTVKSKILRAKQKLQQLYKKGGDINE